MIEAKVLDFIKENEPAFCYEVGAGLKIPYVKAWHALTQLEQKGAVVQHDDARWGMNYDVE